MRWASLHDRDPGPHGHGELRAGPYARQLVVFDGRLRTDAVFRVSADDFGRFTHVGIWGDIKGGLFLASVRLGENENNFPTPNGDGSYNVTVYCSDKEADGAIRN